MTISGMLRLFLPCLIGSVSYHMDGHLLGSFFWFGIISYSAGFVVGIMDEE